MIEFSPEDPFPLVTGVSYQDEQAHAALVDRWLGLRVDEIERSLAGGAGAAGSRDRYWIGLPSRALLTPYTELRAMLARLDSFGRVVDLGAGYGRMGFVIARHFPRVDFLGVEVVEARVTEGARALREFGAGGRLVQGDLESIDVPEADTYFIYDFGSDRAIEKTLQDLRARASWAPVTVVGRGGATRDAIDKRHPWLSQVNEPRHFAHYSIYRS